MGQSPTPPAGAPAELLGAGAGAGVVTAKLIKLPQPAGEEATYPAALDGSAFGFYFGVRACGGGSSCGVASIPHAIRTLFFWLGSTNSQPVVRASVP